MCLFLTATPNTRNVVGADRLSRLTGLSVVKRQGALHFSYEGSSCGCPLLTDTCEPSADTWDLIPAVLPGLETAFTVLAREAHGFSLLAVWAGDDAESESVMSLPELLTELRANRIRAAHLYRVQAAA